MPTLVIKSVPDSLHRRLKKIAAAHRRSLTQETIHLIEKALTHEEAAAGTSVRQGASYWGRRPLVPSYAEALSSGAFNDGEDSTTGISAQRDER